MPHTRSARKNLRKSSKRRLHNRAVIRAVQTEIKKFLEAIKSGTIDQARQEFRIAVKKVDKAAARRVVHPNLASRKKSQLARALHKKEAAAKAPAP